MKTLKQIIKEGLFDNIGVGVTEKSVEDWINDNFAVSNLKIKSVNNEFIADAKSVRLTNRNATTITNGNFRWGKVGAFNCYNIYTLKSLEGAPTEVENIFRCSMCPELTSLKGCENMIVGNGFYCTHCKNLKTLEGAPKKCVDFQCSFNLSLATLKGCENMVVDYFDCSQCNLRSLEGAPKKCIEFNCENNDFLSNFKGLPKKCDKVICSKCIRTSKDEDILKYCKAKEIVNKNSFL